MKILIFEDELLTAERLVQLIERYDEDIHVLAVIESVHKGVRYLKNEEQPDLIFLDIHLADGSCFELFNLVDIDVPVIFTTAYDQYALKAFKVNSIDYLVKPIDFIELKFSLDKFKKLNATQDNVSDFREVYNQFADNYKSRFLIKMHDQLKYVHTNEISWFENDRGLVYLMTKDGSKHMIDNSLDKIEDMLNPAAFYRLNRQFISNINAIDKIQTYFNGRLKVQLMPDASKEIIISRERVSNFKSWLDT